MPKGAVSVCRPGKHGNPYKIGVNNITVENCLAFFKAYAKDRLRDEPKWLEPLRGKDLACFCPLDSPCHADILLELANAPQVAY
jgi:hypothetical protein